MGPFYFQYKQMAENQIQGANPTVQPLKDFLSDYDFKNEAEYSDLYETDVLVESPSDSRGLY